MDSLRSLHGCRGWLDSQAVLSLTLGDSDLYVRKEEQPNLSDYECRPYKDGTTTETCQLDERASSMFRSTVMPIAGGAQTPNLRSVWSTPLPASNVPTPVCGNNTQEGQEVCDGNTIDCADTGQLIY